MKEMQVVVLLGGLGTRLKAVAEPDIPKAMVDIYGKPFFYYQLQLMRWYGLKDFIFCIGYKGKIIKNFFKDGHKFGVNIRYSDDGKELLGTAGALRKALPLLKDDFIVIYGDSYMDIDYGDLIYIYYDKIKKEKHKKALMAVFKNKNQYDKSNAIFKNGDLLKYDKKNITSEMKYIDYGISILNRNIIKEIAKDKYLDLSDIYHRLVKDRQMLGYEVKDRFYEIGKPSSLEEFRKFIYYRSILKNRDSCKFFKFHKPDDVFKEKG